MRTKQTGRMMTSVRKGPMKPGPGPGPKLKPKPEPEPEIEYDIEELRGARRLNGDAQWQYKVKWADYGARQCTWEPELGLPAELVDAWWAAMLPPTAAQVRAQMQAQALAQAQLLAQAQQQLANAQKQLADLLEKQAP
jgi:hypothetical protein